MWKRQFLSSAICKIFPFKPGCDTNNGGDNGGSGGNGFDGGHGDSSPKPGTSSPTKAAPSPTTHAATSPSRAATTPAPVASNAPPKNSPVPAAAPTTAAVGGAASPAGQGNPEAGAPAQATVSGQQPEQQSSARQQSAGPIQPVNQGPSTGSAKNLGSESGQAHPNTAVAAAGADTALGATPTAPPAFGAGPSNMPDADSSTLPSPASGSQGAANTRRPASPSSSSTTGGAINDGGQSGQSGGTNSNHGPAIAGALVGVIALIVIIALFYRYRRSRVVQPILLPFSRKRRESPSGSYQQQQLPHDNMSENLLGHGPALAGAALQRPANRASDPFSDASSHEPWRADGQPRPLTKPQLGLLQRPDQVKGVLRVAIPREQRLVPLGPPTGASSLSPGFAIPPSPSRSHRSSVSSLHTAERGSSRPSSVGSIGNVSVASSGVLNPSSMPWPVPPSTQHSTASSQSRLGLTRQ